MRLLIRATQAEDLPEILAILNREIAEGAAHFGTEPATLAEIKKEFETSSDYPWTTAFDGGELAGFARASAWKPRGGYLRTCEIGIYVRPEFQGRGIGGMIYRTFLPELQKRGFKTVLAGIALPNAASIRLHERFGFTHVGTLPSVGWKLGEWRDVGYWALVYPDDGL
ncbi:MAG TPA: GNAT family N-acetyltransferase [Fimbriimonadaceae bacterium]|nr:GNAT family N-acetyltransferase [Fimbriimonadaceae bacterium]